MSRRDAALFLLGVLTGVVGASVVIAGTLLALPVPRHVQVDGYAFTLPPVLMTCLHVPLQGGTTFSNWEIYQPMILELEPGAHDVTVSHIFAQVSGHFGGVLG